MNFLNNIGIRGPKERYDKEVVLELPNTFKGVEITGVRRFIIEYL